MPTSSIGLPISLTPEVLRDILRLEPRHWKDLNAQLVRMSATLWEDMSLSDDGFYDRLHNLIKNPKNRREFERATKLGGSWYHAGGLFHRIIQHYVDELIREESFREEIPAKATPRQLIDAVSRHADDDRLANVVWAMLEDGGLADDELSEIAAEHAGVAERLQTVRGTHAIEGGKSNQWEAALSQLGETLDNADPQHPDSSIVEQLAEHVNELRELASSAEAEQAAQAERSAAFLSSLLDLMQRHADVLSDRSSLQPYVDRIKRAPRAIGPPENAAAFLEEFDRSLHSLDEVVLRLRKKSIAVSEADAAERSKLLAEINNLHAAETSQCSEVESLFLRLFGEANPSVTVETTQPPGTPTSTADSDRDVGGDDPSYKVEALPSPPDAVLDGDRAIEPYPETTVDTKIQPPASDPPTRASSEDSTADKLSDHIPSADDLSPYTEDQDSKADSTQTRETSIPRPTGKNKVTPDASNLTSVQRGDLPSATELSTQAGHDSHSVALDALNRMLGSRRFARAYWLTRADPALGDPDLFGALSEGARIGPGDPCPGALVHFLNRLVHKDQWQEEERLLLGASVLGPCLFVDPLPQDIYQLAGELPDGDSPVGQLLRRVRHLCVFQNEKIRPKDLGVESADIARTVQLSEIKSKATQFLQRVPYMRFQYAPAVDAVQYLYRAGSEWHRLHTIVSGDNQTSHLKEARSLVGRLDPSEVIGALHDDAELTALRQPLDGWVRDKLIRHLHDTLALAKEWIRLASATDNGDQGRDRAQSIQLLSALTKSLPNARKELEAAKGGGAVDAFDCVLEDMDARIQGCLPKEIDSISGDLLLLPGLALEDDLEPAESDLKRLRSAILEAEHSEPEPATVLDQCLSRKEYRRARNIIEYCKLEARMRDKYQDAIHNESTHLKDALRELELEIEDAFLLGQLRDEADESEPVEDQTGNALERSELLGVVRDSMRKLSQSDGSADDELRAISRRIDAVRGNVERMTAVRQDRLRREFDAITKQLPDTEQGKADRDYLHQAFNKCVKGNDHVAAFDLLDRGRRAAQRQEAIVRASTGSSDRFDLFLDRIDGYRKALSRRDGLPRLEANIRKGNTFAGIAFGQLDRNRRTEAANAVRAWHFLTQNSFSGAPRALRESLEKILRFIDLPLQEGGIQVADTTQSGFAHVRVTLSRPITSSPLPAFGSSSGLRYEVVVSKTRKEPRQFEEYIRGRSPEGAPVLALLLLPHTPAYRSRWQRHFAQAQLTVLPFDSAFLLHLCGERNRLPVLFELGLPFTWARPYITKGENVASEMFVGRRTETEALIDPRGSCIVFGGRQLGKSALLRHVLREYYAPENSIYVVYLDVDDLGSTDSEEHDKMLTVFWRRVYNELIRCGAIPELPQNILNRDARLVEEMPNSIKTCLAENSQIRIVLLLDETDDLLDCDSTRDFALIRRLRSLMANTDRRFKVIFAGLQSVQRYYNWKNHPFAQLGEEVVVNPLPPAAAQELIIRPLRALGFVFENSRLVLRILSQTNYHPGLIQIIGYRLLANLFEKWHGQDAADPIRLITHEDLLRVERDPSVMDDIRHRFDWTLDLDDRYKVLTYALVLTPDPTAPHRESEFKTIGSEWWKAVFEDMDTLGLRAVLDEMVGLGVLLLRREHEDSVRTYRLRSPNLLRLLGRREAIEDELLRITSQDSVSRPNPRNFHLFVDRKVAAFGPLTNEQVGQIYGQRRPFQLTLVTGSEALGLNAVERQFDKLLCEFGEGEPNERWSQVRYAGTTNADGFLKKLRDSLKARLRPHRYAVVRLGDIDYDGELSALFNRLVRELGQICTNESKAHLVLLIGPRDSWRWLRDRNRESVLARSRVTGIELRRWSAGAIAHAFDSIGARTGSRVAGEEVLKLTSGFHSLVDQGLSRAQPHSSVKADTLVPEWKTLRGEVLADDGIESALLALGLRGTDPELEPCVWEILSLREKSKNGLLVLTDTSFELAAEQVGDARKLLESHVVEIREWIRTMDLARPRNSSKDGAMVMAPWVEEVMLAAEG